jgi:hypothetical protein
VLTPILLADEAFRGYDLPKVPFSEKEKREEGKAERERANPVKDSGVGQQITVPGEKKTYGNGIAPESKRGLSKDSHDGQQEATDSPGKDPTRGAIVGKDAQPYGRPADVQEHRDELSEDVKLIEEMATEAGFSKDERRKIIQSYRDLCRVIPKSEARKIIKVRIGIAYNK